MQPTLFRACAVAAKRLQRFAQAQNDLIRTAIAGRNPPLRAAPNGGYRVSCDR